MEHLRQADKQRIDNNLFKGKEIRMFLNRYCKKKAIEVYIRETIKADNLTLEQKVQDIINVKKKIKEIKHNPQIYKDSIEKS